MSRWVLAKSGLAGLYLAYVTWHIGPSWLLALIALATATGVLLARDAVGMRSALAAGTLVLSVLHARALSDQSPWSAVQLGLAAAVTASSLATLLAVRTDGRAATSSFLTSLIGLALACASEPHPWVAVPFVALSALRPLGAVGAVAARLGWHDGPIDPLLWWSPLTKEARA